MIVTCLQRCLQNMVHVRVKRETEERRYKLEDLLELQNKLMLMSSKGEHGREQVNRFTEVSGSYKNTFEFKVAKKVANLDGYCGITQ